MDHSLSLKSIYFQFTLIPRTSTISKDFLLWQALNIYFYLPVIVRHPNSLCSFLFTELLSAGFLLSLAWCVCTFVCIYVLCAHLVAGKSLGGEIFLADLFFSPVPSNSHFYVLLLWVFLEGGLVWHQLFHPSLKKTIITLLNIRVILNGNFLICCKETYP